MGIDWGNTGFLRLYAVVFGLSTVFTMITWLVSVVKRVIRGVPFGQAIMENIGYLLMSVAVAGFAPAMVAYTVDFIDSAAEAILGDYIAALAVGGGLIFTALGIISISGAGAIIAMPIAGGILLSLFGLWVMLVVRDAMILMGLIFGPLVFSGLVDKDLWGHTRKWVGVMGGLIASKLAIFLALALAGALLDGAMKGLMKGDASFTEAIGASITFLALLFLALVMPFQVAKWLPLVGDEIQSMHQAKGDAMQRAQSSAARVKQGGQSDMKNQAANKPPSGGPGGGAEPGGGGTGAAGTAAGPAAAAVEAKKAIDGAREQVQQAVTDGAANASGAGQQDGSGSGGNPGTGQSGGGGRGPHGGGGTAGARRPAPPPPRRPGAGSGGTPAPPPRPGGQASPPPPAPPPPPGR